MEHRIPFRANTKKREKTNKTKVSQPLAIPSTHQPEEGRKGKQKRGDHEKRNSKRQKSEDNSKKSKTQEKGDDHKEAAPKVEIRPMEIDDLFAVWKLGETLYDPKNWPNLYRTWDTYSVTDLFNTDSEFCIVAESEEDEEIIGFCMGTTIKKASWKYGYLVWLGVAVEFQRHGVARKLFDKFLDLMLEDGARMLLIDTQADNIPALKFFQKIGFVHPQECVYLSKHLTQKPSSELEALQTLRLELPPAKIESIVEDANPEKPKTKKKKTKREKKRRSHEPLDVTVRQATLADVSTIFHLGEKIFTAAKSPSHYRSWDQFTVVEAFNGDPELTLVAEVDNKIVGFCMGTIIQKSNLDRHYGYITWVGVKEKLRRRGIGTMLYREILTRLEKAKVGVLLIDTEANNSVTALYFFVKLGFRQPVKHVYLDYNVTDLQKERTENETAT